MNYTTKEEMFKYYKDNLKTLVKEKKSAIKQADPVIFVSVKNINKEFATKSDTVSVQLKENEILAKVVMNTTNLIDSHMDCHIPGLWKKTIAENPTTTHLQEHVRTFDHVISNNAIPSVKMMNWTDLGFQYEGKTQALIFDTVIEKERNEFMYNQYLKGWVTQHSVGMQYVDIFLCINSEEKYYQEEKGYWDKYYPQVVNKKVADDFGLFWAVTTAKLIEGSAVVFGSNYATPTLGITEPDSTQSEPDSTQSNKNMAAKSTIEFSKLKFKN